MGMKVITRWLLPCTILLGGLTACSGSSDQTGSGPTTTTTQVTTAAVNDDGGIGTADLVPGDEWVVEEPELEGMDPAQLDRARRYAFEDGKNTQGVVVVRRGVIVSEWYADGADADSWVASWSVAKSFASAVAGIAIEEGKIASVDAPASDHLAAWKGSDKADITVEDILQMQSGLRWNEEYTPSAAGASDVVQMGLSTDQLAYAMDRPVAAAPGTTWVYSSGDSMILSGIIQSATGELTGDYATEKLFEPIGMERADWWQDADEHTLGYCCLDATARGFARFGLLYLREGRWGDEQVVPEAWVEASIEDAPGDHPGYGYMWWLPDLEGVPDDLFAAEGHDGQFIYVIPSLDLVVVRTGTYVKDPGPSIGDPNLFARYPPDDLVPGKGTKPPDEWDAAEFLAPIVESVRG